MKVLFVHQNYPGQFLHLAPALVARGHEVLALTDAANTRQSGIRTVRYKHEVPRPDPKACRLGRTLTEMSDRGVSCARAARILRERHGFVPDVVFGHAGWGETLFLREIWPEARHVSYGEFFYRPQGADVGFDPEFARDGFEQGLITRTRTAHLALAMLDADAAVAPTRWQASTFPDDLRHKIEVIFDGVDTELLRPDPQAEFAVQDGPVLRAGDEVVTFINRNLEPYRGYHVFMRALPAVLAARPRAQVVIVGGDDVSYGPKPLEGTWKARFLDEVADRIDPGRVHFVGKLPYGQFVRLLQVSQVHAYLTYPFVLSWSMLEAMSAGCHVVGSRTPPVEELISDGVNGRLVEFFDVTAWSKALIEGLETPARFEPLRRAARATIRQGYDLRSVCLPRMCAFVEAVGAPR